MKTLNFNQLRSAVALEISRRITSENDSIEKIIEVFYEYKSVKITGGITETRIRDLKRDFHRGLMTSYDVFCRISDFVFEED